MSSDASLLGRWGEKQAAGYLHQKGYRLLAAGYRCRMGEIDLIAQKGRELAFVEVKLRRNARFAEPREQVTAANSGASCWRRGTSSPSTRNMVSITAASMWQKSMRRTDCKRPSRRSATMSTHSGEEVRDEDPLF